MVVPTKKQVKSVVLYEFGKNVKACEAANAIERTYVFPLQN